MNMLAPINEAQAQPVEVAPRRAALWRRAMWIAVPVVVLAGGYELVQRPNPAMAAPSPPTVTVATPLQRDVTEWDDYVGRFEPSRSVEVRPRVSGAVVGDPLHRRRRSSRQGSRSSRSIRVPIAAALAEARAGIASASSDLALAPRRLRPSAKLVDVDAVSKSEVDRLKARVQAASAGLAAAQARVRARALDMEFTMSARRSAGAFPTARSTPAIWSRQARGRMRTLLTTINALDPIYFTFDGSEALFLKAKRARRWPPRPPVRDPLAGRGRLSLAGPSSTSPITGSTRSPARSAAARCCAIPACS